jgi:uncharacterized protein (TIRG00374 family)
MKKKKQGLKWLIRGIGIIILIYILSRIDIATLRHQIVSADLRYLLAAVLLAPLFILLKAYRFRLILDNLGLKLKSAEAFHLYALGLLAGIATPGQIGELTKGIYLKGKGHPLSSSLIAVIADRGFDIAGLLLLSVGSLLVLRGPLYRHLFLFISFFVIAVFLLITLIHPGTRRLALKKIAPFFLKGKTDLSSNNAALIKGSFSSGSFLTLLSITITAFLFAFFRYFLLARALEINIPALSFFAVVVLAQGISLIPITIAGVGTRDAVLIFLFSQLGASAELAVSLSFLILFLMLINAAIGLYSWLRLSR